MDAECKKQVEQELLKLDDIVKLLKVLVIELIGEDSLPKLSTGSDS